MGLKTEPREASFPWLRRCYGSRLQLHVQLQTWSTSNFHPLAVLRLELVLEPTVEPCQRGPKIDTRSRETRVRLYETRGQAS